MPTIDPYLILEALADQLRVIDGQGVYRTAIGQTVYLFDVQRPGNRLPSIALTTRNFQLDRTAERRGTQPVSQAARGMDLVVEAAIQASPEQVARKGVDMLLDIEHAMAIKTGAAPRGTFGITFSTAQILDRPEGIDAAVLQIIGSADYLFRP